MSINKSEKWIEDKVFEACVLDVLKELKIYKEDYFAPHTIFKLLKEFEMRLLIKEVDEATYVVCIYDEILEKVAAGRYIFLKK